MYCRDRENDGTLSLEARIWLKVGYAKGRIDERKDNIELYERQEEFGFAYLLTLIDELESHLGPLTREEKEINEPDPVLT